ncbi:MAG: twin transmembrane helix small protein, partial [Gammaproteobacteria bacterium]
RIAVIVLLIGIVGSLASALVYLFKDDNDSRRTVRALTVRIGLSVSLFVLLLLAYALGFIQPGALGR